MTRKFRAVTIQFNRSRRCKIANSGMAGLGVLPVEAGESLSGVPRYWTTENGREVLDLFLSNGVVLIGIPVGAVEII